MLIASKQHLDFDSILQKLNESKLIRNYSDLKIAKDLSKRKQGYSKIYCTSIIENSITYNDEKQYYKIKDKHVSYFVPNISSNPPIIHKKYLERIKAIVHLVDIDPDNYSAESQRWIDKNDKGFSTKFTSVYERRKMNMKSFINTNEKLNYKLRKEREALNFEYSQ